MAIATPGPPVDTRTAEMELIKLHRDTYSLKRAAGAFDRAADHLDWNRQGAMWKQLKLLAIEYRRGALDIDRRLVDLEIAATAA